MASANNVKQIGLAMFNYESAMKKLPPAFTVDKNGKPLHSWRTLLLPYLEQSALYDKLKLDEPWDSDHNLPLLKEAVIPAYNSPAHGPSTKTTYQTIRAANSMFPGKDSVTFAKVKDGLSNTLLVVETNLDKAVEWYKPDDFVPDEKDPRKGLTGVWPGLILVGMGDGSVRFISDLIPIETFRRLIDKADGNPIDQGDLDAGRPDEFRRDRAVENLQPEEPERAPPPRLEPRLKKGEKDPTAPPEFKSIP